MTKKRRQKKRIVWEKVPFPPPNQEGQAESRAKRQDNWKKQHRDRERKDR